MIGARSRAGSGNPPSSVRSGSVEAEGQSHGRGTYTEGVGGTCTCMECRTQTLKSGFLLESWDLEGNLCPERDWKGKLPGRCCECCRGEGPAETEDMYAELLLKKTEEHITPKFQQECNKRHRKRSDVK